MSSENYGSVLKDCSKAIALNPQSSKAYYRSALALNALERYDEALDCCERCLQFDKGNKSVQMVREKAAWSKEAKERKERDVRERAFKKQLEAQRLTAALKVGHLIQFVFPQTTKPLPGT